MPDGNGSEDSQHDDVEPLRFAEVENERVVCLVTGSYRLESSKETEVHPCEIRWGYGPRYDDIPKEGHSDLDVQRVILGMPRKVLQQKKLIIASK